MTPSQLEKRVVADRLDWIEKMIHEINRLPMDSYEAFSADSRNIWSAESCLRRALEALLDLGRHILAKGFGRGVSDYKQIAAEKLHYAQSSISAQIKSLEDELGVKLFDRLGRSIVLTEAGERLLQYSKRIMALEEETRAEIAGEKDPKGTLTIRIPETLGIYRLPPIIRQFRSRFPSVSSRIMSLLTAGPPETSPWRRLMPAGYARPRS